MNRSTRSGASSGTLPPASLAGAAVVDLQAEGFNSSYHNKETILFTIDPHYGKVPKPRSPGIKPEKNIKGPPLY